jgi:hypothetical protein
MQQSRRGAVCPGRVARGSAHATASVFASSWPLPHSLERLLLWHVLIYVGHSEVPGYLQEQQQASLVPRGG